MSRDISLKVQFFSIGLYTFSMMRWILTSGDIYYENEREIVLNFPLCLMNGHARMVLEEIQIDDVIDVVIIDFWIINFFP